jgi:hypothetical protein
MRYLKSPKKLVLRKPTKKSRKKAETKMNKIEINCSEVQKIKRNIKPEF